ncbi:MAG: ABC transporter ATP-binding protein [Ignavibacteria bacterium]|nr:ABC transporter ATP-binding protein [Ignavibacteria bacterium]
MLEIKNLTKKFGIITALNEISLSINRGEFFGLLGPNGAGKSTLMDLIIGYSFPDSGHIILEDETILFNNIEIKKKIGYVPQEISLYKDFTAFQNLEIFGRFFGLKGNVLKSRINEVLELVQLETRAKSKVEEFSGGMKRRLNLAASILHNPGLILCDEPTVGVDPQSRNAIFEMLKKLNSEGKTIIYTTHYMEEAERLCSKMAIIDNGKIIAEGNLKDLINKAGNKEKVKIIKNRETEKFCNEFKEMGIFSENEYYYEILPEKKYESLSVLFGRFENLEIKKGYIEMQRPALEDVFLTLTGRSLRD